MKRFVNTFVVFFLTFAGPLLIANAWIWLLIHAGALKALFFGLMLLTASVAKRTGPRLAARYVAWRVKVALARNDVGAVIRAAEGRVP